MKRYWILTPLIALLVACQSEQATSLQGKVLLTLNGGASGMFVTKAPATVELPASTPVGVYATQTGAEATTLATTPYNNVLYTATGVGGTFTSTAPISLVSNNTYNICAYAPIINNSSLISTSSLSFVHGTDVLYAPASSILATGSSVQAALTFQHMMSQVKFVLAAGQGTPNLVGATLNVSGFLDGAILNLDTGTLTSATGANSVVSVINTPVCVAPSATPLNLLITVNTTDGKQYTGTLSTAFVPSTSYTYTLTLNLNEVELTIGSAQVVNWIAVDSGSAVIVI